MADDPAPDRAARVLRFALYGPANAGKTCILAALAMPHAATPGLSAVWRGSASDTPRPEGPEESWSPDDPAVARYRGAVWLRESIRALDAGTNPPPNPNREPFRFRFDFRAEGFEYPVELFDYSGELLDPNVSADRLSARLRDHLRGCDGLLVLAEAPRPDEPTARAGELHELTMAFALLRDEGNAGLAGDVAIALVVNKWDRRGDRADAATLDAFLAEDRAESHRRLRDALRTRNPDNFGIFATSAFGKSDAAAPGDRPPAERPLPSFGLEEPFLWAARRTLAQSADRELAAVRAESDRFRWWKILQPFTGRRSRLRKAVEHLRRDYPDDFPHSAAARQAYAGTRPAIPRQLAALAVAVFFAWGTATAVVDLIRYTRHRPALDGNEGVALANLELADRWLSAYRERHLLWSPFSPLVLSRSGAEAKAPSLSDRVEAARCRSVADTAFRDRLAAWTETLDGAHSLESLANLLGQTHGEPRDAVSDDLRVEFGRFRGQLEEKYQKAKEQADLTDAEVRYYDQIKEGRIVEAAATLAALANRPDAGQQRGILVRNFRKRTVEIFERQLQDCRNSQNTGDWTKAGNGMDSAMKDERVRSLLSPENLQSIESTWRDFQVANDRRLYESVRNPRKKPEEACDDYLNEKWSTRSMHKFVTDYRAYLLKLKGPLEVAVVLQRIDFGGEGWDSAKNRVKVYANNELLLDKDDVTSRKGESTHDVGAFTITVMRSDPIAIRVEIDCMSGNFVFSNRSQGSGSAEWTIDDLHKKIREIDLMRFGNRAAFTLRGLPKAPDLPDYSK